MKSFLGGTIAELVEEKKEENARAVGVVSSPVIPEINCLWYSGDVLRALDFLHKKGIVHRDVKGNNQFSTDSLRLVRL